MSKKELNRRDFIKISSMTAAGGLILSSGLLKTVSAAQEKDKKKDGKKGKVTKTPTYCEMCTYKCAGWVYQKDGKPWKIIGNDIDEHSYGRMCTKGTAGIGSYEDPDRLKTPLIRTGERGKQVFKEATWDEAFTYIADKMAKMKEQYGPECVALFTHGAGGGFFKTLLKGFGSSNITAPSYGNCRGPREEAYYLTFGDGVQSPEVTDMKNSTCIVLHGSHIGENTHSKQVNEFGEARAKGAKLIVVDPRFSTAASKADYWLPIKPSTDMALTLAWINVIIEEGLYDHRYVEKYTTGFEELKASVKKNTPEWAYPITSIKPELIRETARVIGKSAPGTLIHPGRLSVWQKDSTQRIRAGAILNALLGAWGKKGGLFLPRKAKVKKFPHMKFPKPKKTWRDAFPGKYKLANLSLAGGVCDATIPSLDNNCSFKGWLVYGSNLINTLPDREKTIKAIQNLDLLVVVDTMPAETTGYADVVLPECTYLERYDDVRVSNGREAQIALRMPAFKPKYNSKPASWMIKGLAKKMGLEAFFPWNTIEEYLDYRFKSVGSSLAEMKKIGVKNLKSDQPNYIERDEDYEFFTDSGKIEIYSQILEDNGLDPIPQYKPNPEPEAGFYRLLTGRTPMHSFGRTTNNPILTQLCPENELWVNSDVAKDWDIKNGQYIKVENQDGILSNDIKVKVTQRIRTDCVFMVHGFGRTQKQMRKSYLKGANDAELMSNVSVDEVMGGSGILNNFVTFKV